jgi:hypothetical protein
LLVKTSSVGSDTAKVDDLAAVGLFLLVILLGSMLFFAGFFAWVFAVYDAMRRPAVEWQAIGQDKTLWVAVLFVTFFMAGGLPGAALYLLVPYRAFRQIETARAETVSAPVVASPERAQVVTPAAVEEPPVGGEEPAKAGASTDQAGR